MFQSKYQFRIGDVLFWLSMFALALALRFDPHLPFLVTMFCLGTAVAIKMRKGKSLRKRIASSFFTGLALGPPLLIMGLYANTLDWPIPPNPRVVWLSRRAWWEVGSAIAVGAGISSLVAAAGGLVVSGAEFVRRLLQRERSSASSWARARDLLAPLVILGAFAFSVALIAVHGWRAQTELYLLRTVRNSGLTAYSNHQSYTFPLGVPDWLEWWLSESSRLGLRVPEGYWLIGKAPLTDEQLKGILRLHRLSKLTSLTINCHNSSEGQIRQTIDKLNQAELRQTVMLNFANSQSTAIQLPILENAHFPFGVYMSGSDIDDDTLEVLRGIQCLKSIEADRCELSLEAKRAFAAARSIMRGVSTW